MTGPLTRRELERQERALLVALVEVRSKLGTSGRAAARRPRRQRSDPVAKLVEQGKLDDGHLAAVETIRKTFELVGKGIFPSQAWKDERRAQGLPVSRHPLERMSAGEVVIFRDVYEPWARACGEIEVGPGVTLLQVAWSVIIDGMTVTQAEERYRVPRGHGGLVKLLRRALSLWPLATTAGG